MQLEARLDLRPYLGLRRPGVLATPAAPVRGRAFGAPQLGIGRVGGDGEAVRAPAVVPAPMLDAADRNLHLSADRDQHGLVDRAVLLCADDQLTLVEEDRLIGGVVDKHVVDVAVLGGLGDERAMFDGLRKTAVKKLRLRPEDRIDSERAGDLRVSEMESDGGFCGHRREVVPAARDLTNTVGRVAVPSALLSRRRPEPGAHDAP